MPYSWEFMKQFNFSNPPTVAFTRNQTVEDDYSKHGELIKKAGGVEPYLKSKYLPEGTNYKMTNNNFPYDLEEDIRHFVIWFRMEKFDDFNNPAEVRKIIAQYKLENNVEFDEVVFFQNIERLRSVPGIPHIHVFAKL